MTQLFKNAARAALTASILAGDTSLPVDITKADLFPVANTNTDPVPTLGKDWFKVVLEDVSHNIEIVYVRTRALGSAVMSNLLRGQEGTTALAFASGSIVGLRLTSLDLQAPIDLAVQATTPGKDVLWAATVDAQVQKLGTGLQKQVATAFTTTGTATAYAITPTPAIAAYAANLSFDTTFHVASGANPTLAISGLATPPNLVKQNVDGSYTNIGAGELTLNHRSRVTLLSPTQALVERMPIAQAATLLKSNITVGGTADAITLTLVPASTVLDSGIKSYRAASSNATTTPTCATDGLAAKTYVKGPNLPLVAGDIQAGMQVLSKYDPTYDKEILLNPYYGVSPTNVGIIFDFAGTAAPAGALACPTVQTNISRTTYARLFAAIGTTWGAGDGSTTFGMPWFPADYAAVQANANVGSQSAGQVISHTHTVNVWGDTVISSFSHVSGTDSGAPSAITGDIGSTGGSANLAAGVRVLKCVWI